MGEHSFKENHRQLAVFRWGIALLGLVSLGALLIWQIPDTQHAGLSLIFFLAALFSALFPFRWLGGVYTMANAISLTAALVSGPFWGGLAAGAGALLGALLQRRLPLWTIPARIRLPRWNEAAFAGALQALPAISAGLVFSYGVGAQSFPVQAILLASLVFAGLHALLYLGDSALRKQLPTSDRTNNLLVLLWLELLPVTLALLALAAYPFAAAAALGGLIVAAGILGVVLSYYNAASQNLERRLQELSIVQHLSESLNSARSLDTLFQTLGAEITSYLNIDNFYIALYDDAQQQLTYPIAVKYGQPRQWRPRQPMDRLTDRVILQGQPILIPHNAIRELLRSGMPTGEDPIYAWLGVPITTPIKVVGCLGVFSIRPEVAFHQSDLELLNTVAGLVGVAIQNARLYDQLERRAGQLETLNTLSSLMTGSLNLSEVLTQVCQAGLSLSNACCSAIILVESGDTHSLAHSAGLAEPIQANLRGALRQGRLHPLVSGKLLLVNDIQQADIEEDDRLTLTQAGILALGAFPLATPNEQVGILLVGHKHVHSFPADQVDLLQNLAGQAALAVANARLYASTDQALANRIHQLAIIDDVGRKILASFEADRLFQMILDYALEFTGSPWGHISLLDDKETTLIEKAQRGYARSQPVRTMGRSITWRAIHTRQIINVPNVLIDPDFVDLTNGQSRAQLSVPLIHDERTLGVITLESPRQNAFGENEQSLVSRLATQAALALRNAELVAGIINGRDRLSAILNSVGEGILMLDSQGQVVLANQPVLKASKLSGDQLLGLSYLELPAGLLRLLDVHPTELRALIHALQDGESLQTSRLTVQQAETKPERFYERTIQTVLNAADRPIGAMFVLRDITEEYQLQSARQAITDTLIHDLRSPISTVMSALEVLADYQAKTEAGDELVQEAYRVARRSTERVYNLVTSLLEIARMQSGKIDLNPTAFRLSGLVDEVLGDFKVRAHEYEIKLVNQVESNLPLAIADTGKIERVLANLLDNALKFSPSGSQVTVDARSLENDWLIIEVQDQGSGIPVEYRQKIFDRFNQVPGQSSRRRGTGLGLAFCRLVIEAHGGKIWVETGETTGSRFIFTLPCVPVT